MFAQGEKEQDFLWKFNLPSSERTKVLQALERNNVNADSLFGSEEIPMEPLIQTRAQRELLFRHPGGGGGPREK